jgi:pilus assembly protein CpaB
MAGPLDQKGARLADPAKGRLRALLFLVGATAAALFTAALLTRYMDTRIAAVRVPTVKVVVASSQLDIATPLQADVLTTIDWPRASVPAGTFSDPKELLGKVVNSNIAKGEAILASKVASGDPGSSALASVLTPGMRAVSVRVDDVVGVAGFIHPGDHVDVIVTMSGPDANTPTSKIILQDIKVLAVGKEPDLHATQPRSGPATVATLMVDSEQTERLALAASKGQLLLALRGNVDSDVVVTQGVGPLALVGGPPQHKPEPPPPEPVHEKEKVRRVVAVRPPTQAPVPVTSPSPPPQRESKMVEILRGDLFEKRDFQNQKESNP